MAIRRILKGNHTVLRSQARPVKKINQAIITLLDDMAETMYEYEGVGLAAPQIGIAKRLIVLDPGEDHLMKLINPRCIEMEGEENGVEGCLSIPGIFGEVPRAFRVQVEALDPGGNLIQIEATGFLARILQHEIDHLNGILFLDRAIRLVDPAERPEEERA
ncbi:MAG: peptide deformylase [Dethiobacteria bacterium]|nr:peptide deformylase [Bacillota bacterium]NMD33634.1 peptide deformylase [Bacillota bacterium]